MTDLRLQSRHLSDLDSLAAALAAFGADVPVWLFEGSMGAGKTTLIQALCHHWGVPGPVQSPTFSLVNEYETTAGEIIYHFDLYRLRSEAEAYDIGLEEYLDSGRRCLVEWPSQAPALLPPDALRIDLSVDLPTGTRTIFARHPRAVLIHP
jgi:tRNA threonylcarbamoyladenosine biosynthesis protein TsaE